VSGGGDPNSHMVSTSVTVGGGSPIQITLQAGAVTINVGGTAFIPMTVTASPGEGTITFACSGLPFGASCSFNPPSTNQTNSTVTLGITTSAGTGSVLPLEREKAPPLYAALLPVLGLAGLAFGRRKGKAGRLRLAFVLAGMALVFLLLGCGGTRTTPPTPQGTFQVTVTGTSASTGDSGSAVVAVTVPQ